MGDLDCIRRFPNAHFRRHLCPLASPPPPSSSPPGKTLLLFSPTSNTQTRTINTKNASAGYTSNTRRTIKPTQNQQTQQQKQQNDDDVDDRAEEQEKGEDENRAQGRGRGNWTIVLSSSLVGLLTGIGVVLFNYSVHEIHDVFWGGMPQRGASLPQDALEDGSQDKNGNEQGGEKGENLLVKMGMPVWVFDGLKAASRPFSRQLLLVSHLGLGTR